MIQDKKMNLTRKPTSRVPRAGCHKAAPVIKNVRFNMEEKRH